MSQMKGQDKTPEKQPNEVEIGDLPEKGFRILTVKMIQGLRKKKKNGEDARNVYSTSKILVQIWWRNQNLPRQAKVKRIQHHQTNFITNTKGTSLCKKQKKRNRPTQDKPRTVKKMVIGSSIAMITLNVNGLNAPTKRLRLAGLMKTCACMHFCLPHHST